MKLVLEDGTELPGQGFGGHKSVAGEVVFNTAMTGYIETLTDPSYKGQILVTTYPLMGNYGVPQTRHQSSMDEPFESGEIHVQGLVVQNYISAYSHHSAQRSLGDWLDKQNIPAITGIDTRVLTQKLREHGTMKGWLFPAKQTLDEAKHTAHSVDMKDGVFYAVAPPHITHYKSGPLTILLIDIGAKDNITRSLLKRGASVVRAPWHEDILSLAGKADGVMISNGPGDPKNLVPLIDSLKILLNTYSKPVFGICLGHQLMCLAAGGDTIKLPYGHRGVNQPVQDLLSRKCYITSQNHGYAVRDGSLPGAWEPWFVNTNDGTNEGYRSLNRPHFSVQFHPESHPGPSDTEFLFDYFLSLVNAMAKDN